MKIPVSKIISNQGQIEGLPKNPRVLRDEQFDRLKKSIEANPDMLELRELLVVPHEDKWIVIAGNMRLRAMQDLGMKDAPCKVIPPGTPASKLRAFTILDNAQFGEWDWDDLSNEWDAGELDAWGIQLPDKTIDQEYTQKIESLQYEPSDTVQFIDNLYDYDKYQSLLSEIEAADIDSEEKDFLKLAASRHIVFNYKNIADYYSRADLVSQKLFEKSALVIIDFQDAIANGFVKLQEDLRESYLKDYE